MFLATDGDPAFGKKVFDISGAQIEAVIRPNGI
jgi:hypothetical protein